MNVGDIFGKLTVIDNSGFKNCTSYVDVKCECGTTKQVRVDHLKSKKTVSCGCHRRQAVAASVRKHGMSASTEYKIWMKMKERCYSKSCPEYKYYGGSGITICDRWLEPNGQGFINFYNDMGKRPSNEYSIDRIDNTKGYSLENCRWADNYTQANNKRNNNIITFNGKTQTLTEWARELGIKDKTLFTRVYDGWSIERALTTPVQSKK